MFKASELSDDSYEYDDTTEMVLFKCHSCNNMVDGMIRYGLVMKATCDVCGTEV